MIKLVALDLDDTLLGSDNLVSLANRRAIAEVVARGIKVIISTGRMYISALAVARQLGLDLPIISYQGALIKTSLGGKVLYHQPLGLALARELIELARLESPAITAQAYLDDQLCVSRINAKVAAYSDISQVDPLAVGDLAAYLDRGPEKLLYIGEPGHLDRLWRELSQRYQGRLYITKSKPYFLEFLNPLANKGLALRFLGEYFGIAQEEIMACGDNFNDMELFKAAGIKVAMKNGVEELKAAADFITTSHDSDGVSVAIRKFVR